MSYAKHHLARRRARIHLLRERNEFDAESTEILKRPEQMTN